MLFLAFSLLVRSWWWWWLLSLLASDGGGEGSGKFTLEVVQLGLEREQGLVNLLLVVSVDAGGGEGGNPGQGDQGQTIEDGPDIGQQVHAHGELEQEIVLSDGADILRKIKMTPQGFTSSFIKVSEIH